MHGAGAPDRGLRVVVWQSGFPSRAVLVVPSIFLRHKGSPESQPVTAPNRKAVNE